MSYKVQFTTTKPANVQWYRQVNKNSVDQLDDWAKTLPGFISSTLVSKTDTQRVKIYEFDTQANFNAFLNARKARADHAARKAYNQTNNIVTTRTVL